MPNVIACHLDSSSGDHRMGTGSVAAYRCAPADPGNLPPRSRTSMSPKASTPTATTQRLCPTHSDSYTARTAPRLVGDGVAPAAASRPAGRRPGCRSATNPPKPHPVPKRGRWALAGPGVPVLAADPDRSAPSKPVGVVPEHELLEFFGAGAVAGHLPLGETFEVSLARCAGREE